jgi:release factor glutamine methyltransferase
MSQGAVTWTPLELIRVSAEYLADHGVANARLDAELLLADVLRMDRLQLYLEHERPLIPDELDRYRELVRRRARREPLQILIGRVQLHELEFEVREGVFIPRHETEVLIEGVKTLRFPEGKAPRRILEVGTGTGCVGISLLVHWSEAELLGFDISAPAIDLSAANAERHGVQSRLRLVHGDAFALAHREEWSGLDLVVSNPPYVNDGYRDRLEPEVVEHDPPEALFAGPEGLDRIVQLIHGSADGLRPGGWLAFEHGHDQEARVAALLDGDAWDQRSCLRDLAERPRVTLARRSVHA